MENSLYPFATKSVWMSSTWPIRLFPYSFTVKGESGPVLR